MRHIENNRCNFMMSRDWHLSYVAETAMKNRNSKFNAILAVVQQ